MAGKQPEGILIVDDDALVRRAVIRVLRPLGVPLREAPSADAALIALRSEPPEVVLTDYSMPGMSGREFVEHIARDHPFIRVVVHSGNALHLLAGSWWPSFDVAIVPKPAPSDVLLRVVKDALKAR